ATRRLRVPGLGHRGLPGRGERRARGRRNGVGGGRARRARPAVPARRADRASRAVVLRPLMLRSVRPRLRFGYSPCPNDTFAFHALAHGLVDAPFDVEPVLLDIEELN